MGRAAAMTVVMALLLACMPTPPAAPITREPTAVEASFGRTWDAVIDVFAQRNIPIRTMERVSGFVAAEPMRVPYPAKVEERDRWADCGADVLGTKDYPEMATYNVLVRGDSSRSTVKVTARWTSSTAVADCGTKGIWESEFESVVKARAEAPAS